MLAGCEMSHGLRASAEPNFDGNWACVIDNINSSGLSAFVEEQESNTLSVSRSNDGKYLFSVTPNYGSTMELFFMEINRFPGCEDTALSLDTMNKFIGIMMSHCNYKAKLYRADMACISSKSLNPTAGPTTNDGQQ